MGSRLRFRLSLEEGWLTLVLIFLVQWPLIHSIEGAGWVDKMPELGLILLLSIFWGLVLAKIKVPSPLLHPWALVMGIMVVVWRMVEIIPGPSWDARFVDLVVRTSQWVEVWQRGGISSDPVPFQLQVAAAAWFNGYFASWFVFRRQPVWIGSLLSWLSARLGFTSLARGIDTLFGIAFREGRVWWVIIPAGVALLVNLSYLPAAFPWDLFVYLLASMLLVVKLNYVELRFRWQGRQMGMPDFLQANLLGHGLFFGIVVLFLAWMLPPSPPVSQVVEGWQMVNRPWDDFQTEFSRLFSGLRSQKQIRLHVFGAAMPFRGAISLGDETVFVADSAVPGYWRATTYDVYTPRGWVSTPRITVDKAAGESLAEGYAVRKEITQTITLTMASDVFFVAGAPLHITLPSRGEKPGPMSFSLDLRDGGRNQELPPDLRNLAAQLGPLSRSQSPNALLSQVPPDLKVEKVDLRGSRVQALQVSRASSLGDELSALRSTGRLKPGDSYRVVSSVPLASASGLRRAGTDYPQWVTDRYLQLAPELPSRVQVLAKDVVKGEDNAYDKALAIETFLRSFSYDLNVWLPSYGTDAVDHFLFTTRKGYGDYFASAMVVMMRGVGVPARLTVGYVSGEYDAGQGGFVVKEHNAHAWPEVFFPGYGWIIFEPTPIWPSLERPDSAVEEEITGGGSVGAFDEEEEEDLFNDLSSLTPATGAFPWQEVSWVALWFFLALGVLSLAGYWAWNWGLKGLPLAFQVYEKMSRLARLGRLAQRRDETPREYTAKLAARLPVQSWAIQRITAMYEKSRFGGKTLEEGEKQGVEQAWHLLRNKLVLWLLRWK